MLVSTVASVSVQPQQSDRQILDFPASGNTEKKKSNSFRHKINAFFDRTGLTSSTSHILFEVILWSRETLSTNLTH